MLFRIPSQIRELKEFVDQLQGKWVCHIRPPNRSLDQNAYFYWYVQMLADYTGYSPTQTKSIIKQSVTDKWILKMAERIVTKNGTEIIDYKSTADLSKDEFSLLMKHTIQLCDAMWIQYKYDPIQFATDLFSN